MTDMSVNVPAFDVVLADDDQTILDALILLLGDHDGLNIVATAMTGIDAADQCRILQPHLAVLDVMMPAGGLDGLQAVQAASPSTEVVFYTARTDRRTRHRLIEAGALAVFAKGASIDLADELHRAARQAFDNLANRTLPVPDQATDQEGPSRC